MAPKVKAPSLDYNGPMEGSGNYFFPDGALYSGVAADNENFDNGMMHGSYLGMSDWNMHGLDL